MPLSSSIFPLVITSLILIIYFLDDVLVMLRENWCWLVKGRVLNKSQRPAKFTSYFKWTRHLLFFGRKNKRPPKSQNLVMSVVFFQHSDFCSKMLEMHPEMPRFQNFYLEPLVTRAFSAPKLSLWCNFFSYLPTPKLLPPSKTSLKTLKRVNIDVSGYEQALHLWVL